MSDTLEVNLNIKNEKEQLSELYWGEAPNPYALGDSIKIMLTKMFGMGGPDIHIKGTAAQIAAFGNALTKEKRYIENYMRHGLDNPQTYRNQYELDRAINQFERETGLQWPFK